MKKTKLLICLWALIMLSSLNIEAQTKATWTTTIDYNMKWLRVTPFGQVIASTSKGLLGIEPVTGQTIWTITELTNCDKNSYTTIEGSSYISITTASNWTSTSSMSDVPNKLNERVYIIDPIKGAIVFSSKDSGLKDANERYFLHNLNKLLVFGKPLEGKKVLSMMVDLKTGKVLWTKENGFKFTTSVVGIDNDQVIIVSPAFVTKINASTGEEIWRKTLDPKFAKMASFVSKTEKMLPADAEDRLSKIYFPPSRPEIFIVGVPKHFEEETLVSGSSNSSSSSGLFGSNKKKDNFANEYSSEFSAFNIKTGEYIWEFVNELKNTKLGVSFPLDDGFLVSAKDDGFYKIFKYEPDNVKTVQKGLFKGMKVVDNVREKSVKGVLKGISKLNNGTILMQCLDGKNSLVRVVDQSTGKLIYEKAAEIQGEITYVNEVNKGVVIGTSKSVGILDPVSGSWINIKPMECNPALIKMNKEKIILFNSLDNKLYSLAIDKTEFLPFSSSISFEDKKIPTNMELRKDGIFISSNQNMSLLNYDGSIKYQKHFLNLKTRFLLMP